MLPNRLANFNVLAAVSPGAIKDNAAFTSNVIDLGAEAVQGAAALLFLVTLGSIDADVTTLKVMESDTQTNATTLGGTPVQVVDVLDTVTPGAADDNAVYGVMVDLSAQREQYLQLQATAGDGAAGTYCTVICLALAPHVIAENNNLTGAASG